MRRIRVRAVIALSLCALLSATPPASALDRAVRDRTVWGWGRNLEGQLGLGEASQWRLSPTPIPSSWLVDVVALDGGSRHSLALKRDGTIWAWGDTGPYNPHPIYPLPGHGVGIAAGDGHNLGLLTDGTVWAWGRNSVGQLGDGTTTDRFLPVRVGTLSGIVDIAAGDDHGLAVRADGTVWAWGRNTQGQLGDGTTASKSSPVRVSGLGDVVAVGAGGHHSLAVRADGTVWAWGRNNQGQLGDGSTAGKTTPVLVLGLVGAVEVSAGSFHSMALRADGTVWSWGSNLYGQLGVGDLNETHPGLPSTHVPSATRPLLVSELLMGVAIAAGDAHSLALRADGTVWSWGRNDFGQLGLDHRLHRRTPVRIDVLIDGAAIGAGTLHSLAATRNCPPRSLEPLDLVDSVGCSTLDQ